MRDLASLALLVVAVAVPVGLMTYLLMRHDDPVSRLIASSGTVLFATGALALMVMVRIMVRWHEHLRLEVSGSGIRIAWPALLRRAGVL